MYGEFWFTKSTFCFIVLKHNCLLATIYLLKETIYYFLLNMITFAAQKKLFLRVDG